ncbi:MAG: hypothetical protein C5B49_07355 [Bdellovibrio sp.]|nr:MAG: hypothetical protein C5B49_07355 [Bdellovibrio sp.]
MTNDVTLEMDGTLRRFVATTMGSVAMFDRDMKYLAASPRWKRDFDLTDRDLVGCSHYEIFPENTEEWRSLHQRSLDGEVIRIQGLEFRRKSGVTQVLNCETRPWSLAPPRVDGILISAEDITDQIKLKASEAKYENLLESAQDGIVIFNDQGKIVLVNQRIVDWFGFEKKDLIGQDIEILLPTKYRAHPFERLNGRTHLNIKVNRNGCEMPADISLSSSNSTEGTLVTAIIRDMSEIQKRETHLEFLASSDQTLFGTINFEKTVSNIARVTVPALADSCIVRMLEGEKLTGLTAVHQNPMKQKLYESLAVDMRHLDNLQDEVRQVIGKGHPLVIERVEGFPFAGEPNADMKIVLTTYGIKSFVWVPMRYQGQIVGMVSFMIDESDRQFASTDAVFLEAVAARIAMSIENARLYNEIQKAVRAREDILAMTTHDLKNPVAAIRLSTHLMARAESLTAAEIQEFCGRIDRSATQMQILISDLVDLSRLQKGTFSVDPSSHPLAALMETTLEPLKLQAQARGQVLTLDVPDDLGPVLCDTNRLGHAISNIVGNAIKFAPCGGFIEIKAENANQDAVGAVGAVLISVRDNGPGIPADQLQRVFDQYWQLPSASNMGSGLGLFIAKGIVESHGGKIWAESIVGQGSTFFFTIPRAKEDPKSSVAARPPHLSLTHPELNGLRIMLVDDSEDLQALMKTLLRRMGAIVFSAGSVHEAKMRLAYPLWPQLILSDIEMPGETGFDLLRHVQNEKINVPVIAVTGHERLDDLKKIDEAGFAGRIPKPCEPEQTFQIIKNVLIHSRLENRSSARA